MWQCRLRSWLYRRELRVWSSLTVRRPPYPCGATNPNSAQRTSSPLQTTHRATRGVVKSEKPSFRGGGGSRPSVPITGAHDVLPRASWKVTGLIIPVRFKDPTQGWGSSLPYVIGCIRALCDGKLSPVYRSLEPGPDSGDRPLSAVAEHRFTIQIS